MAAKPLTSDAIALTEKKMDMTLDEIIKMSKKPANQAKNFRISNKSPRNFRNAAKEKSMKFGHFMDTRSSLRQGVIARKRSNFQPNHFPLATEAARKAGVNPYGGRAFNRDKTAKVYRPRAGAVFSQKRIANGAVAAKAWNHLMQHKENESNGGANQRPKTLDSLFADLKLQRMKASPRQINSVPRQMNTVPRNRGGRPIPPWHRARFRN